jgi:hypothetical protein
MSLEQTIAFLSKGEVNEALKIMKKDAKEFKNTAGMEIYNAFKCLFHPKAPHKENFGEIAKIYYEVLLFPYK